MPASNARAADLLVIDLPSIDPGCLGTIDPRSLLLSAGRPIPVTWKNLLPAAALGEPKPRLTRLTVALALVATIGRGDRLAAGESARVVVRFHVGRGMNAHRDLIDVAKSDAAEALNEVAGDAA